MKSRIIAFEINYPNNTLFIGGETLDECGLKFLLAVRLHTFLTTSLPPAHRAQLLHQGNTVAIYVYPKKFRDNCMLFY